ncbi:RNA-binding protein 41 isoform X2 [Ictalurus punctatus]|uniref:RNA-binding protein 41 isoform X2 n=1 Tax=Ictalurus punctatus TaxID=7998 RepID=A0A2D0SZF8_ICTPU|nr:RNA-binding protein 41 isoform X2 [Ictalurus punctatus]
MKDSKTALTTHPRVLCFDNDPSAVNRKLSFYHGNMKRVTRRVCDDGPVPEEQETEGQRQLHNLLLQQLDTDVDIDRCVAKKKCFAPAALYKPFGEQAAGVRSLAQFQALQDGEKELADLRELGLTDSEIELWRNRDVQGGGGKNRGVSVAPEARDERLQVIWDKMAARAELLSRPQRFSGSRALTRREMEIEKALFHGSDRSSFLTALYHQERDSQNGQQEANFSNPMDSLYREFLKDQQRDPESVTHSSQTDPDHSQAPRPDPDSDRSHALDDCNGRSSESNQSTPTVGATQSPRPESSSSSSSSVPQKLTVNQPIGRVTSRQGRSSPVTVSGKVEEISDEEIRNNRETEDGIRGMSRFQDYQRGEPSNVLCVKNMSPRASLAQLVALFSRFQKDDTNPIVYRLLTGRLKGQAFITLSDIETAQAALDTVNGYRLQDKPLVIEFARERRRAKTEDSSSEIHSTTTVQEDVKNCSS